MVSTRRFAHREKTASKCSPALPSLTVPPPGAIRIYDDKRFDLVAEIALAGVDQATFVNDVIITKTAAYITDSFQPQMYKVGLA